MVFANEFLSSVLKSDYIAFSIDDLSAHPECRDLYLYPRGNPSEMGILYFSTKVYRNKDNKNDILYSEEYDQLQTSLRKNYTEHHLIHIAKATQEAYKSNVPFIAQIVVDVYNQLFPQKAVNAERLWSERAKAQGVSDLDLFFVDHAERIKNIEYLQRLAKGISKYEDPHGNLAKAARAVLRRLGY